MKERLSPPLRLVIMQDTPCHDPDEAIARLDRAAAQACADPAGADLLIAPEMWLGGYHIGTERSAALAARAEKLSQAVAAIARRHRVAILTGMAQPAPSANGERRPFNSALMVGPGGAILSRYNKTHLYGEVDRAQFIPGTELSQIVVLNGWCIAIAICFDIEFPETARALALAGADLIAVPTANMMPFDSVATRIVPARAEENGLFVAYANYCGSEPPFDYCGLSCICGPDGEDLARAGRDPTLIRATLDPTAMNRRRKMLNYLHQRRLDIY